MGGSNNHAMKPLMFQTQIVILNKKKYEKLFHNVLNKQYNVKQNQFEVPEN